MVVRGRANLGRASPGSILGRKRDFQIELDSPSRGLVVSWRTIGAVQSDDYQDVILEETDTLTNKSELASKSSSDPSGRNFSVSRAPLGVIPAILGVAVLALNIFMWAPNQWVFRPVGWGGFVSFILLATSTLIGVLLIVYPIVLSRLVESSNDDRSRRPVGFAQLVAVPIVLGLFAPLLTAAAFDYQRGLSGVSRSPKSCIEVYEAAANLRKVDPKFQMPATDPDEQRCLVNQAVGR